VPLPLPLEACVTLCVSGGWAAGVAELLTAECGSLLKAQHKQSVFHLEAAHPPPGSPAAAALAGLSAAPPCMWFVRPDQPQGPGPPAGAGPGTATSGGVAWPVRVGDTADIEAFLKVPGHAAGGVAPPPTTPAPPPVAT